MSETRRITLYDIPQGTVQGVLDTKYGQRIMSGETMAPGLYQREPMCSSPHSKLMCLGPFDDQTPFCKYWVVRADVQQFACTFVRENSRANSSLAATIGETAKALARGQAEQVLSQVE